MVYNAVEGCDLDDETDVREVASKANPQAHTIASVNEVYSGEYTGCISRIVEEVMR